MAKKNMGETQKHWVETKPNSKVCIFIKLFIGSTKTGKIFYYDRNKISGHQVWGGMIGEEKELSGVILLYLNYGGIT